MTRIAVFGGTFDPPHLGHVRAAQWVVRTGEVDSLLVVPVFEHAFGKQPWLGFQERCELCRLAFSGQANVTVSEIEKTLPRPNYTIETIRELARRQPEASFRLVVGTDILSDLPRWRDGEALLAMAPPLVLRRKGHPGPGEPADLPEIASSELRGLLARNSAVPESPDILARLRESLDERVLSHILSRGYYSQVPAWA